MALSFGEYYVIVKRILYKLYDKIFEDDVFSYTAQVAFYLSFSLFPLLLFLVNLFGLILGKADDLRIELFSYLRQIMPFSAYQLVQKTILEVSENSSSSKLTIGFLIALWSASAGMDSLRVALNKVYELKETRSWWNTKFQSLVLTLVLILLISLGLAIVFYGWKMLSVLLEAIYLPVPPYSILVVIQWISFLIVLLLTFGLLYNFLPNVEEYKHKWISYGSATALVLWLILTSGFRLYLHFFNNYDKTYGSLGAVIILMLWLYLTSLVILIGASINSILENRHHLEPIPEKETEDETAA
ncbi:MAG TPA: YihY/virulence factor BrkB family protein [Pyrinomonadaceae bacterium]|nr:YihY/virulence factor BrkB family protein [Pyrinomonadaceae bacterium]